MFKTVTKYEMDSVMDIMSKENYYLSFKRACENVEGKKL